jgi:hypothetical protein
MGKINNEPVLHLYLFVCLTLEAMAFLNGQGDDALFFCYALVEPPDEFDYQGKCHKGGCAEKDPGQIVCRMFHCFFQNDRDLGLVDLPSLTPVIYCRSIKLSLFCGFFTRKKSFGLRNSSWLVGLVRGPVGLIGPGRSSRINGQCDPQVKRG